MTEERKTLIEAILLISKWMDSKKDCFNLCMELENCVMQIKKIPLEEFFGTEEDEE